MRQQTGLNAWAIAVNLAATVATILLAHPTTAAEPPPPNEAARLVTQLASREFVVREGAASRLLRLGGEALPEVTAAALSADPETRSRALRLRVELEERLFNERLARFVSDISAGGDVAPAGWREFERLLRATGASRSVYAELYRSDPELMEAAFSETAASEPRPTQPLAKLIESRASLLQDRNTRRHRSQQERVDPVAEMLALLTVAASHPEKVTERATQLMIQLARTSLAPVARKDPRRGGATRELLTTWIEGSMTEDLYVLSQMLQLAVNLDLRELSPLAIEIAAGGRTSRPAHPQFRASALLMAGKLGDARDALRLEPLLKDHSVCASQSGRGADREKLQNVEIRDVALAVILHLEGKSPAENGFDEAQSHPEKLFVLHSLAFPSEALRDQAITAWRADRLETPRIRVATEAADSALR